MIFDVLTLFPQMFESVLGDSIIGRARANNLLEMKSPLLIVAETSCKG